MTLNSFKTKNKLEINGKTYFYFDLNKIAKKFNLNLENIPSSIKILLENLLRNEDGVSVDSKMITHFCKNLFNKNIKSEIVFSPTRVLMQDFTGVPAIADLAAMRDALKSNNIDPKKVNPISRVDLVIDHSVMVDKFGSVDSLYQNTKNEFIRNRERYEFLKWGQKSFDNFFLVPPGSGICHQVNLENIAKTIWIKDSSKNKYLFPDSVIGTDSHTTMVNALSVLGWGVGGIEAEAAMLGQPVSMNIPKVVGFKISGSLNEGITATDLVLNITNKLRAHKVVGKFVEFFGTGIKNLTLADRATISNMAPEYGATCGFFPTDNETINYLKLTGKDAQHLNIIKSYTKKQKLWHDDNYKCKFDAIIDYNLNEVEATIAGPKRPQDKISLFDVPKNFNLLVKTKNQKRKNIRELISGDIVIAAITSCTNTSNPSVMIAAGLLAKKAVAKGLQTKHWVKTSLAPGSKVVSDYLKKSNLSKYLDKIGFNLVGYGCTTCIGNSGPLNVWITNEINKKKLTVCSVLSGNRNFEGRIHQEIKANYLASPPLVVAYALAGNIYINLQKDPIGFDKNNNKIYLKDIWPSSKEINSMIKKSLTKEMFISRYKKIYKGDENWNKIKIIKDNTYSWNDASTYIKQPPFFNFNLNDNYEENDIINARQLLMLGDSVTTDHISPAGAIKEESPAGKYLSERQIRKKDFNSYGSRRGNHEIMLRGTFANTRIKNEILSNIEGGLTKSFITNKVMSVFDAAQEYKKNSIPLVVFAGKEYGTGSSRDWAAKGTKLLGVRAVIAESFERIHRSNLIGVGVLPLEFIRGNNRKKLKLNGKEIITIKNLKNLYPNKIVNCYIQHNGKKRQIKLKCRIDTNKEIDYYKSGGILNFVLNSIIAQAS